MIIRSVYLYIAIFGANVRICRCGGEPAAAAEVPFGSGGIAVAGGEQADERARVGAPDLGYLGAA
jgi:hypothetical protein